MKSRLFFLLLTVALLGSCKQSSTSAEADEAKTKVQESATSNAANTESSSIESDIQFIKDKYAIISQATGYKAIPFEIKCDERSLSKLERRYNEKDELSYLKYVSCGGHGCITKHHYYWEGKLIFIFHENDYTPGSSHIIEEHRTYFKNGKMIRCLEKEAHYHEGKAPMEELLKQAENKEVACSPDKLTANLSEIESLDFATARQYFCSSSQ